MMYRALRVVTLSLAGFIVLMLAMCCPVEAAYFDTIVKDYKHPKVAIGFLYTPQFVFDGASTDIGIVYHPANADDSLWPKKLLDLGFPPIAWSLLEVGGGGNRYEAFAKVGASIEVAQTVLGPVTEALKRAGGKAAIVGSLLTSERGGVRAGIGWKCNVIAGGVIPPLNELRFPPRYTFGYGYKF